VLALALVVPMAGGWDLDTERPPRDSRQGQRGEGQRGGGSRTTLTPALGPSWSWWRDDQVKLDLGLTDDQVARIEAIYRERQEALGPFVREWFRQDRATAEMASARTASVEEFNLQVANLEALRAKLNESRTVMLYRMVLELDDEQYSKLQQVRDRRSRGGRGEARRNNNSDR
jgi:hypothetical protein